MGRERPDAGEGRERAAREAPRRRDHASEWSEWLRESGEGREERR